MPIISELYSHTHTSPQVVNTILRILLYTLEVNTLIRTTHFT